MVGLQFVIGGVLLGAVLLVAVVLLAVFPWVGGALLLASGGGMIAHGRGRAKRKTAWYVSGGIACAIGLAVVLGSALSTDGRSASPSASAAPAHHYSHAFLVALDALEPADMVRVGINKNNMSERFVREVEIWPQVTGGVGVRVTFSPDHPATSGSDARDAVAAEMAKLDAAFYASYLRPHLKWVQVVAYWPGLSQGVSAGYIYNARLDASEASDVDWHSPASIESHWTVLSRDKGAFGAN